MKLEWAVGHWVNFIPAGFNFEDNESRINRRKRLAIPSSCYLFICTPCLKFPTGQQKFHFSKTLTKIPWTEKRSHYYYLYVKGSIDYNGL